MPLTKLQFKPGVNQEVTSYSNENGWRDCDKIRFRFGYPEKLGGWVKYSENTYLGTARRLHNWIALDGSNFLGVGTTFKYYIEEGTEFNDVTPIRKSTTNSTTFAATNGSSVVTVTESSHGAVEGDFVTFSSAVSLGGLVTATILNAEHQITQVLNGSSYTITVSVTANSSDTGNGGSATDAVYQINTGTDSAVGGTGWGAGNWGGFTGTALQTTINEGAEYSNSDTTLTVASASGIVATDTLLIEEELLTVTNVSSADLTVTRGVSGTEASAHANGTTVFLAKGNADSAQDFTGWGDAAAGGLTVSGGQIRLWSHDNFGEDLLMNVRDGEMFYWDKSDGLSNRAVELTSEGTFTDSTVDTDGDTTLAMDSTANVKIGFLISGTDIPSGAFVSAINSNGTAFTISAAATGTTSNLTATFTPQTPSVAKQILVSDTDRHVIAFGCNPVGSSVQDPLLIRFSSQEDFLDWYPHAGNTAGDLRLGAGSEFIQAVETKREILVFTDTSLHSMRFIGPPFTFGLTQLSSNITIASSGAAVATEDLVFWMGIDNFYIHSGQTAHLPCSVKEKVFLDFNSEQSQKVVAGVNSEYSEVFWFYPSASSNENDRYVVYNYGQKIWYFGTMIRTAWIDRGSRQFPIAAGGSHLFNHESGYDDDTSAMTSFVESTVMDIGDGDRFHYIRRIVPDISFAGSSSSAVPAATLTIKSRNFPGTNFGDTNAGTVTRTSATPVELYTDQVHIRSRGRSFALRIESENKGVKWKLGSPRIDIRPDGRK